MKIQIEVNGKKIDAYVNDNDMEAALEPRETGYERAQYKEVYYYNHCGSVNINKDTMWYSDTNEYKSGNYYTNKQVAENNSRADNLMRNLRRFAAEHGGCPSHKTYQKTAFEIGISNEEHLCIRPVYTNYIGNILFMTKDIAKKAIDTFHDELIWYFTEYNPMPEGWWNNDNSK